MSSRIVCAVLGLAMVVACLGGTARVSAKPPDLPINLQDIFTPQLAPQAGGVDAPLSRGAITIAQAGSYDPPPVDLFLPLANKAPLVLPDSKSPPARPKVSLKTRRNLATCLLFSVHPLLALAATEEMVETSADHPCGFQGPTKIGLGWDFANQDTTDAACPYLQKQECQQDTMAYPPVTRDVLTTLQSLMDAEDLFNVAEKLRQRGQVCEALDCYEIVSKLCPGSRVEQMANQAKTKMFAGLYCAEPLTCLEEQDVALPPMVEDKPVVDHKAELKSKLLQPVNVSFDNTTLNQVVDDFRNFYGMNIVVDTPALEDRGISLLTPITIKLEQVEMKSALKLMLHQARLTYVYKGDVLLIVPEEKKTSKHSEKMGQCEPGVREQVNGLMKACHLAVEMGRYQKAAELAREAHVMDHEKVEADPLVYKMHLVGCALETCCPKGCQVGCCMGACTGGIVGSATGPCGHGSVMGAGFGGCMARVGCCCQSESCCQGCCKGKCCQDCPECCCKSCGNCKYSCYEGQKCLCCEAKTKGCQSCGCCCSPCKAKAAVSDCPRPLGRGKKTKCGHRCRSNAEEECAETECPVKEPCTSGPMNNNQPPCTGQAVPQCPPPMNDSEDDGGSAQLQPTLPPVSGTIVQALEKVLAEAEEQEAREDLVVVEEDSSSKPKIEFMLGLNLVPSKFSVFETTCSDIQVTPEQIKVIWQVKVGPWVCQICYGQPGLQVDVQPLEPMDD